MSHALPTRWTDHELAAELELQDQVATWSCWCGWSLTVNVRADGAVVLTAIARAAQRAAGLVVEDADRVTAGVGHEDVPDQVVRAAMLEAMGQVLTAVTPVVEAGILTTTRSC
jgi:hypothetical protein